jgi:hypothetical protein
MNKLYSLSLNNKIYVITSDNIHESSIKFKKMFPKNEILNNMISEYINGVCISVGGTYCYMCETDNIGICGCSSKIHCNSITH